MLLVSFTVGSNITSRSKISAGVRARYGDKFCLTHGCSRIAATVIRYCGVMTERKGLRGKQADK